MAGGHAVKILLISGHGAGDSGAVATIDGKKYQEADLTVEVVDKLAPLLRKKGAEVTVYDKTRDAFKDYKLGTLFLGKHDYILEIHFNACVEDYNGDGKVTGTEIYYPSKGKESGAEGAILKNLAALGFKNRGVKSGAFAVINRAAALGMSANLLEVCFIDDADDVRLYNANKDKVAEAIADGIAEAFKLSAPLPWYEQTGELAEAMNFGITDGTRPDAPVTRAECAVMVLRGVKIVRGD